MLEDFLMRLITYFGQDESKTTLTLHSKFECENVRGYKNLDVFSKFVEQSFQSFLTHKRKKTVYIAGLSFVLFHLCKMIQEDESEHLTVVFNPLDFDKDRCKERGEYSHLARTPLGMTNIHSTRWFSHIPR